MINNSMIDMLMNHRFIRKYKDSKRKEELAQIAAQSFGLGGVVLGGIRNDAEKVHSMFRLADLVIPLFLLCLGYSDSNPGLKPRLPW